MTVPSRFELPYPDDVAELFRPLASKPWAHWLDSAGCDRYDILVANPVATLVTRGECTTLVRADGQLHETSANPLQLLRVELARVGQNGEGIAPFSGGAVGYFSYDLARRFDSLPNYATDDLEMPELAFGIYTWAVVVDHHQRRCWLAGDADGLAQWQVLQTSECTQGGFAVQSEPRSDMEPHDYAVAFARVQHYLREGDCYQVNLAQRFCTASSGEAFELYATLRRENPAPFSAYLNFPFGQVLSASPERFLQLRDRRIQTKPIKGTRRRGSDAVEDRQLVQALQNSPKDRAENLMIVDLLRNDLGKVCVPGSVQVPNLFAIESFATVHHLVSTISGELAREHDALDLLRGCFPGGSITGAPKRRAMEIIEELEPHRRGVYCGNIGYIGFDGSMDTNIAIRTLVNTRGRTCFATGGGVVADSTTVDEYQESLDKAAVLLRVLALHRVASP